MEHSAWVSGCEGKREMEADVFVAAFLFDMGETYGWLHAVGKESIEKKRM